MTMVIVEITMFILFSCPRWNLSLRRPLNHIAQFLHYLNDLHKGDTEVVSWVSGFVGIGFEEGCTLRALRPCVGVGSGILNPFCLAFHSYLCESQCSYATLWVSAILTCNVPLTFKLSLISFVFFQLNLGQFSVLYVIHCPTWVLSEFLI